MQLNSILIRNHSVRGDLGPPVLSPCLDALGLRRHGDATANVPGAFVARTALDLIDGGAREVVRVADDQGYTVISDGSGDLVMELETWCALSKQLNTRIVTARHDELGVEFAVFENGKLLRLASWEAGELPLQRGEPLPQECLFSESCPTIAELVEWLSCMGLDLERLNRRALYTLQPVLPATQRTLNRHGATPALCVAV